MRQILAAVAEVVRLQAYRLNSRLQLPQEQDLKSHYESFDLVPESLLFDDELSLLGRQKQCGEGQHGSGLPVRLSGKRMRPILVNGIQVSSYCQP